MKKKHLTASEMQAIGWANRPPDSPAGRDQSQEFFTECRFIGLLTDVSG